MFTRGNKGRADGAPTVVGAETTFKGNIVSKGAVHVDGQVTGDIRCQRLLIGPGGTVLGEIDSESAEIFGMLKGTLRSRNTFLAKTAKVIGDIFHETLQVEAGAQVEGRWSKLEGKTEQATGKSPVALPTPISPPEPMHRSKRGNGHAHESLDVEAAAQSS